MKWKDINKQQKIYIIGFGLLVALLLWTFVTAGVITRGFNREQLSGDNDKQEAFINGIIITETQDKKKYWEIYAEKGKYDSTQEEAMLFNIVGNCYDEQERVSMSFQSTEGTYNSQTKVITLNKNVYIVLHDGTTLNADKLRYAGDKEPIIANGNITVTKGKEFLAKSDEIEITPDFERLKIRGHAVTKLFENRR